VSPEGSTPDVVHELDAALGGVRHDRYGWFGAIGRDLLLRGLAANPPVDPLTYRVLRYVDAAPGETVRVRHIGELLLCDRARASRVVHRLVDQGLLTLQVSQADARQRQLDLTAAGTALLAQARSWRRTRLGQVVADWESAEVAALAGLLRRLQRDSDRLRPCTAPAPHASTVSVPDDLDATPASPPTER